MQSSTSRWVSLVIPLAIGLNGCSDASDSTEDTAKAGADLDVSQFHGWNQIPNHILNSDPAVTLYGGTRTGLSASISTTVYGRGGDNAVWFNSVDNVGATATDWQGWQSLGGSFTSEPAAARWSTSTETFGRETIVVAREGDDAIWANWTVTSAGTSTFQQWTQIPNGTFTSGPGVTAEVQVTPQGTLKNTIYVVARGGDDAIWVTHNDVTSGLNPSNWAAWTPIPEGVFADCRPAIATSQDNELVVLGRGLDNQFWYNTSADGVSWAGWQVLPNGVFTSAPAVSAHQGNVEVSGTGTDGRIWTTTLNPVTGVSSGFVPIPLGIFQSGPGSAADTTTGSDLFEVVGLGTDGTYYMDIWR
jgi:hypothetical protein